MSTTEFGIVTPQMLNCHIVIHFFAVLIMHYIKKGPSSFDAHRSLPLLATSTKQGTENANM